MKKFSQPNSSFTVVDLDFKTTMNKRRFRRLRHAYRSVNREFYLAPPSKRAMREFDRMFDK